VIDEIFNTYLIPEMFAQVAQGKMSPSDAVSAFARKANAIYRKWRNQKLV
jgi:multiple sugar transport system substrate-binding protein